MYTWNMYICNIDILQQSLLSLIDYTSPLNLYQLFVRFLTIQVLANRRPLKCYCITFNSYWHGYLRYKQFTLRASSSLNHLNGWPLVYFVIYIIIATQAYIECDQNSDKGIQNNAKKAFKQICIHINNNFLVTD